MRKSKQSDILIRHVQVVSSVQRVSRFDSVDNLLPQMMEYISSHQLNSHSSQVFETGKWTKQKPLLTGLVRRGFSFAVEYKLLLADQKRRTIVQLKIQVLELLPPVS